MADSSGNPNSLRTKLFFGTLFGGVLGGVGLMALTMWLWKYLGVGHGPISPIVMGLAAWKGITLGSGWGRAAILLLLRHYLRAGWVATTFALIGAAWVTFVLLSGFFGQIEDELPLWQFLLLLEGPTLVLILLLAQLARWSFARHATLKNQEEQ